MNEEWFDVVNERDEVIDRRPRAVVHAIGLRHRAVHVLVFNGRGEVFLQKRSMSKDTSPGAWDSSASGHVDAGEDYDACALRELREELGMEMEVGEAPRRLFKLEACEETGQEFVWVYQVTAEGPFALHPEEIERGDWYGLEALAEWLADEPGDFANAFRLVWRTFLNAPSVGEGC